VLTAIQLLGAILNMGAFALLHFEIASSSAYRYLVPNIVGSLLLGAVALLDHLWGFLLLEGSWVAVAAYAVAVRLRETIARRSTT
jgi:hypothetical protein